MKIAIVGSRGIPASYSGFETSVQETAVRFVQNRIETLVYCRSNYFRPKLRSYKGVRLCYLPSIKTKHLDTITHTFLSVIFSLFSGVDAVIMYGLGNSVFLPVYKMLSIPVIAVIDGADWERGKWGAVAKWFLRMNKNLAVRFSSYFVVDNELLCQKYREEYGKTPVYIPYGANSLSEYSSTPLSRFGLKRKEFIIFVGRFVKEKGIDFLIQNFEKMRTNVKLVIVGGNEIDKEYDAYLRRTQDGRIVFTGFLYGNEYESLLQDSLFYVSCSYLEGTSPSLLSAMVINGFALVSDLEENREVLKSTCATFKTGDGKDFRSKLSYYLENQEIIEKDRVKTKEIVAKYYTWEKISKQYIDLLDRINAN